MTAIANRYRWTGRRCIFSADDGCADAVHDFDSKLEEDSSTCGATSEPANLDGRREADALHFCHPEAARIVYEQFKFTHLTPIQRVTVPILLENPHFDPFSPSAGDVVITAPTGQGKTLCYALPIVSALYHSGMRLLKALVIAPTRELVCQIAKVFDVFCQSSSKRSALLPIRVCVLAGTRPFSLESADLHGTHSENAEVSSREEGWYKVKASVPAPANIVVATPGRFVEHCHIGSTFSAAVVLHQLGEITMEKGTQQKTYSHSSLLGDPAHQEDLWASVEWIVMDEADRLLDQNYQNWIAELNSLTRRCIVRPRRIVASATMTRNPEKLHLLSLQKPMYFCTTDQEYSYTVPPALQQKWVLCPALSTEYGSSQVKPLVLLYLLHQLYTPHAEATGSSKKPIKTIIFCSSKSMTLMVSTLINVHFGAPVDILPVYPPKLHLVDMTVPEAATGNELIEVESHALLPLRAKDFTADLSQQHRSRLIHKFETLDPFSEGAIDILVGSDILARGLDITTLDVVINYDCPLNLRTYIHRVGRTGRAGRRGMTFTLVSSDELPAFKRMLKGNQLPLVDNEIDEPFSLWDIVHKHSIFPDHLIPWVSTTPFEGLDSQPGSFDDDKRSQKNRRQPSYYTTLLQRLQT